MAKRDLSCHLVTRGLEPGWCMYNGKMYHIDPEHPDYAIMSGHPCHFDDRHLRSVKLDNVPKLVREYLTELWQAAHRNGPTTSSSSGTENQPGT